MIYTRLDSAPGQVSAEMEAVVCELRREHPRWGPVRLTHEVKRAGASPAPSRMSVYRVLVRHGLIEPQPRKRPKDSYVRWERDAPMALWQLDIVGGVPNARGSLPILDGWVRNDPDPYLGTRWPAVD